LEKEEREKAGQFLSACTDDLMRRYDFAFGWVLCRWAMGTWESKEAELKIKIPK
jgi:hypothetical protein